MKKEFTLYVCNAGNAGGLSSDQHLAFIKKCEYYIGRLEKEGKSIAARPIVREGCVVSKSPTGWRTATIDSSKEVQMDFYHIRVNTMEEAIGIAKDNPEFDFVPSASIEIRPIKIKEEETNFVDPNSSRFIQKMLLSIEKWILLK